MQNSMAMFNRAAQSISDPSKMVDAQEIVEMQLAQIRFAANAAVMAQSDEADRHVIDIIA